jgi:hypothetical protein
MTGTSTNTKKLPVGLIKETMIAITAKIGNERLDRLMWSA